MPAKVDTYLDLARETALGLAGSVGAWTAFLDTASRLYKYPFADQLMIHAQRPEATACASYEVWNGTMRRYVRHGAKGIALVDNSGDAPRLRYVFDIADTGTRRSSRPFSPWEINDGNLAEVQLGLRQAFNAEGDWLSSQLQDVARDLAEMYFDAHRHDIAGIIDGSLMAGYDEGELRDSFTKAAYASTAYALLSRCGYDPAAYFDEADFAFISEWNTSEAVTALGTAVSENAQMVLRQIERTIRSYERSQNHDRDKATFDCGSSTKRKVNPEYERMRGTIKRAQRRNAKMWDELDEAERKQKAAEIRYMKTEHRKLLRSDPFDANYKSLQYIRYADDFIIGVIGSKEDAEAIKSDLANYLREKLKLTLSAEKTKITHTSGFARFLGYDITVSRSQEVKKSKKGYKSRVYSAVVKLYTPHEKYKAKLLELGAIRITKDSAGQEHWKAIHRGKLINRTDIEILSKYNAEVRGLANYYALACNPTALAHFSSLMKYSMLETFAAKYRTKVSKIKARYVKNGNFTVAYETKSGMKESVYYNKGFKRKTEPFFGQVDLLETYKKYAKPNGLLRKLRAKTCELCGAICDDLEIHQVKRLKGLTGNTAWEAVMLSRHRKTLAVCPACHKEIHASIKS